MRLRDYAMPVLTGLVVAMFALVFVGPLPGVLPGPGALLTVLFYVAVFLLVTVVVYRKRSRPEREESGRSIWDAIPSWQYTGRHVESGGITVDGQERALRDVQEQAAEREER